jgi:hydrogenase/urease accessory protein HupE
MVHNLPMIFATLRIWALVLLCLLTTTAAQAHPGHDGHEEGDGFTWTYAHLTTHPLATVLCLAGLGLAVWLVRRTLRLKQRQPKAGAMSTPAADTLS